MCDSNCYQRLSWENGPSDNKVLVYHHTASFDCEYPDVSIISWLPRRMESHKPWLSFPTELQRRNNKEGPDSKWPWSPAIHVNTGTIKTLAPLPHYPHVAESIREVRGGRGWGRMICSRDILVQWLDVYASGMMSADWSSSLRSWRDIQSKPLYWDSLTTWNWPSRLASIGQTS